MSKQHSYTSTVVWTGNRGQGTSTYRGYERTWEVQTPGKPVIQCSNDPMLGGDPRRPNPEDLLLASLSACHMLWYLHLAAEAGVVVTGYRDEPIGVGETNPDGAGRFLRVTLHPTIEVSRGTDRTRADAIHREVHRYCFIARSMNFPVDCEATYVEP
ncbi:MAG: OsmC family protein [Polyangiaceae bacterium]